MSLLAPLRRSLKKFGIYLLPLPTAAIQPGTILDRKGQPVQHLLDLRTGKLDFFSAFSGPVRAGEPYSASAVLSSHDHTVSVGGGIGADVHFFKSKRLLVQPSVSFQQVCEDPYGGQPPVADCELGPGGSLSVMVAF